MGYRGKVEEQTRARELRARGHTLLDIATELGVSKSSVSVWVRDVEFTPSPRRTGAHRRPHPAHEAKLRQIEELNAEGRARLGVLSEEAFLAAGIALYAGEGAKTDGCVGFPNTDPRMVSFFCRWLRHFFEVDESRLRVRLYLHEDLDLTAAADFWAEVTGIPTDQFHRAYRAIADTSRRSRRHEFGCATVVYGCSTTHRRIMGLVRALLTSRFLPG